jgi:hypothetical protein
VTDCKRHAGKGFTRKENLDEHYRCVHSIAGSEIDTLQLRPFANDAGPGDEPTSSALQPPPSTTANTYDISDQTPSAGDVLYRQPAVYPPARFHALAEYAPMTSAMMESQPHMRGSLRNRPRQSSSGLLQDTTNLGFHNAWRPLAQRQTSQEPRLYPEQLAHTRDANMAVQTQNLSPRPRSASQMLTPNIRGTIERPSTPDSQAQQDSPHTSATSLHVPYVYANDTYIDHSPYNLDPSFDHTTGEVQIQGPLSQINHVAHQAGISSPISCTPALSMLEQCLPTSPCDVPIENDAQQRGHKRSYSDAFPKLITHKDTSKCAKNLIGSYPSRVGKVCNSVTQSVETPADSNKDEASGESVSGIQLLMHRWFNASAAAEIRRVCGE